MAMKKRRKRKKTRKPEQDVEYTKPTYDLNLYETSREQAPLTHWLSNTALEMPSLPFDKPLRPDVYNNLTAQMRQGSFLMGSCVIAFIRIEDEGRDYRFNGKHTATGRLKLPMDWHVGKPNINVIWYTVPTMEVAREVYVATDNNKPRTRHDHVRGLLTGREEFDNLITSHLQYYVNGLKIWKHGVDYLPADNTANIRELIDYQELVVRVHSYLKIELGLTDKVFKKYAPKAGINAFLLEVLATYPEHADSFLRPLLKGVGNFGEDDPVMWLRERLDGLKVAARHDKWRVERGSWRVGAKILYWSCCAVWNHWVEGNAIRTLYTPKKKPELLKPNRPLPSNDLSENKED